MAIEIIPKPKTKRPLLLGILLSSVLLLSLAFLISYFILGAYQKKMENELAGIEDKLKEQRQRALEFEEEIFGSETNVGYQQKIKEFGVLIGNHRLPVNLFNFLEENTHPKVWFSEFNLDLENSLLNVSGYADSFETLGQQAMIFMQQSLIRNINLSRVSIAPQGDVNFELGIDIDPKIFK